MYLLILVHVEGKERWFLKWSQSVKSNHNSSRSGQCLPALFGIYVMRPCFVICQSSYWWILMHKPEDCTGLVQFWGAVFHQHPDQAWEGVVLCLCCLMQKMCEKKLAWTIHMKNVTSFAVSSTVSKTFMLFSYTSSFLCSGGAIGGGSLNVNKTFEPTTIFDFSQTLGS